MNFGLHANLVPDRPQLHEHEGVKIFELGIAHGEIFEIEILESVLQGGCAHERVVPFQLHQHCLHSLSNGVLTLAHCVRHWLVHFNHLCLPCGKRILHILTESILVSAQSVSSAYRGKILTLSMLRLMSMSFSGDRPWAKVSGSSENALQKPLCFVRYSPLR